MNLKESIAVHFCCYLLMRFEGPVFLDSRVTKVRHLPQHGCHDSRPDLTCICGYPLPLLISKVLSCPHVKVEGRQSVKETTATIHIPV